jgi:hypothetical protein
MRYWISFSIAVATAVLIAHPAFGGAELQKALDTPIKVQISKAPIKEMFAKLSEESGVEFEIPAGTLDLLPYGERTSLSVSIPNLPLRKALDGVLLPQAMRWEPAGDKIRILPTEPLCRTCRRATFDELKILGALVSKTIKTPPEKGKASVMLRGITGNKDLNIILPENIMQDEVDGMHKRASLYLPCPAAEWLDGLCGNIMTWFVDAHRIFIVHKIRQIERQLNAKVKIEFNKKSAGDVLLELARMGRIKMSFEPGILSTPALEKTDITLVMEDVTISQALAVVSGKTGLELKVAQDGIHVSRPNVKTVGSGSGDPGFFIQTEFKTSSGRVVKVFLRPDEIPEKLMKRIDAEKKMIISELEKHLPPEEEGESEKKAGDE